MASRTGFLGIFIALSIGMAGVAGGSVSDGPNPVAQDLAREECDFWEDPQGVPHVRGRTDRVAMACAGFLHGRDRAWQMDFLRLTVQGRRAETLGQDAIRTDVFMRLLELQARARKLFDELDPETQKDLWAYAYGVNQGFAVGSRRSYEFRELGGKPELWMPWDSIAILLLQSFDQTRRGFEHDIRESTRVKNHPGVDPGFFGESGLPWETTILQDGEGPAAQGTTSGRRSIDFGSGVAMGKGAVDELAALLGEAPSGRLANRGSNNWVIAPSKSATRKAWLANDPHLELKHPPFWYWMHIEGDSIDAIGATLPGVPLIASGANRKLSWGLTNSYFDSADAVLVPDSDLKEVRSARPWIWFKIMGIRLPFFFKKLEWTPQGLPLLPIDALDGHRLVLRWTGFGLKAEQISSLFGVQKASTIQGADEALSKVGLPSWNYVFADTTGGIGFRTIGNVPKRDASYAPGVPVQSLAATTDWALLPSVEMPSSLNPARGWIASANNRQWKRGAGHPDGGTSYADGFRAFRIHEMLSSSTPQSRETIQQSQCDVQAVDARFFLPGLLKHLDAASSGFSAIEKTALETLREWDLLATLECQACGVYRGMMDDLLVDYDWNEPALFRVLQGQAFAGAPDPAQSVVEAFRNALERIGAVKSGKLPEWGNLHAAPFRHTSGLEQFEVPPIATPGDEHSVNPGTGRWRVGGGFEHQIGASQRLIVEMSDPPAVYAVLAGSNTDVSKPNLSRAGSPWRKWAECFVERKFFPVRWETIRSSKIKLLTVQGGEAAGK